MRRRCSIVGFALAATMLAISVTADSGKAHAQLISINITIAPPELPVYDQPPLPAVGYIWIPGYWAWGPDGYYWVPGYWEQPPEVGLLWTPGYWGCNNDGIYAWHGGYWGPHVGFYGGVNYGFGYGGDGYLGGRWDHGVFAYNQTVNNFGGVHVTNVYNQTVVVNNITRVSYNGGTGGTTVQPTPQQVAIAHEQHIAPTQAQTQHQQMASANPALRASENHGRPTIAAVSKPNEFTGKGVVAAREATPTNLKQEEKPGGPGANPNAVRLNSNEKLNPNEKTPGTNPNVANPSGAKTLENKTLEKQTPEKPALSTLERKEPVGNAPKPLNPESKTLGNTPPLKPEKPIPPQPHVVSTPNPPAPHPPTPHPMAVVHPPAPHPQARPAPHPMAVAHPPAPHPAPHPQARPAPHPNNKKQG